MSDKEHSQALHAPHVAPHAPAPHPERATQDRPSNIPAAKNIPENIPDALNEAPKDSAYSGLYIKDDGETYALAIVKDAPNGRTHHAKNSAKYWNGTEAEFKASFEKK